MSVMIATSLAHAETPSTVYVEPNGVAPLLKGFNLVETSMQSLDQYDAVVDLDSVVNTIIGPELGELLNETELYQGKIPELALSDFDPRSRFGALLDGCASTFYDTTPFGLYRHARVSGRDGNTSCHAKAYLEPMHDTVTAPEADLWFAYSGEPIALFDTGRITVTGKSAKNHQTIELEDYRMRRATVGLVGYEIEDASGKPVSLDSIGVALTSLSLKDGVLTFDISTWFSSSGSGYTYRAIYAVIGLPEDASMVASCKSEVQEDLVSTLLEISGLVSERDVETVETYIKENPLTKVMQLNDVPERNHLCLPYVPQGFRFDLVAKAEIWGLKLQLLDFDYPGLALAVNGRRTPLILYDPAPENWKYASNSRLTYFYSYVDQSSANTCPIVKAIPALGQSADVVMPLSATSATQQPYEQDLLVPNLKNWQWWDAAKKDPTMVEVRVDEPNIGDAWIGSYVDGLDYDAHYGDCL